jgi:hypothetical protein
VHERPFIAAALDDGFCARFEETADLPAAPFEDVKLVSVHEEDIDERKARLDLGEVAMEDLLARVERDPIRRLHEGGVL